MIKYYKGDLLDSNCDIIAHQVNLQGVMGGGLALQIATKYPSIERYYKNVVSRKSHLLGKFYGCEAKEDRKIFIVNCFTQDYEFNTDYNALRECFLLFREGAKQIGYKTIGVPKNYGCGIAKGEWSKVEAIFKELFEDEEYLELQIWEI